MGRELTVLVATICLWLPVSGAASASDYKKAEDVFAGGETVVSEPINYPRGKAKVYALIVTLMPGEESGWHQHGVPLFGYILKGEVTVNYGSHGTQTYRQGSGFMDAIATAHNGCNTGAKPCRILAVFIGSEELIFTQRVPAPNP